MPPETSAPKVIHLETEFGDLDPLTGRQGKQSETSIHGLHSTRAEQRLEQPPTPDTMRRTHIK